MKKREFKLLFKRSGRVVIEALFFIMLVFLIPPFVEAEEEVFFYHNDALGSPVAMTDASGAVVWEADYQPFGEEWNLSEVESNGHRFTGKELDSETGLHYFRARYYDSRLGRFISVDPALLSGRPPSTFTIPQRHNLYVYSTNNPYRYVDPDGNFLETAFDVVSLGFSVSEFVQNPSIGNGIAVILDGAATALPFVPGGFGLAIKTTKGADAAVDAGRVVGEVVEQVGKYVPAPKRIEGIPGLRRAKPKTPVPGGGNLKRKRWEDKKGNIYEWDSQHARLEKYNKRGKHQGEFNHETGEQTKPANKTRRVEP